MTEEELLKVIQNTQDMIKVIGDNLQLQINILKKRIDRLEKDNKEH